MIPLEDSWSDVLGKAFRGRDWSLAEASARSGLSEVAVEELLGGSYDGRAALSLGSALGINVAALQAIASGEYHPGPVSLPAGMSLFSSDWGGMQVHSYLAWDAISGGAVAFDTGADASGLIASLERSGLRLGLVLLTHGHGDHLFELDRLAEKTGAEAWIGEGEGIPGVRGFAAGQEFRIGSLLIETRSTPGHSPDGMTYVIHGLEKPVAVVGDALFAGSMGGPNVSYDACLRGLREEILSLPLETVLCPGHGPLSTVGSERSGNPFFAGP
jgi:glyoxylase-like metal-dependent hydrolase (beta-lactamase superfamily II)